MTEAHAAHGSMLPGHLLTQYIDQREAIRARLVDFSQVPASEYFYELCFCLCTPQSKAIHANAVVQRLKAIDFQARGQDPTPILRDPAHYIRFHSTKGARLLKLRDQWPDIEPLLASTMPPDVIRTMLVDKVNGFGMKEASHALRNIGKRGLAIIDRHLLTNLVACGVFATIPSVSSRSQYLHVEDQFRRYARTVGIDMDELDLLFWASQAGLILK